MPEPRNISLLADYAREIVREYMHLRADDEPEESKDPNDRAFSGFRVSGREVAKQFRASNPELFTDDVEASRARRNSILDAWLSNPPRSLEPLAEMAVLFELNRDDLELFIMTAAPAIDPEVDELFAYVRNNVHKRQADIGFLCQLISMTDKPHFERLLRRCDFDAPLRRHRLIIAEARSTADDDLDINLVNRRVRSADRVLDFLRYHRDEGGPPVDEVLANLSARLPGSVPIESLGLPDSAANALLNLARARILPIVLLGPEGAGKLRTARAIAGPTKHGVLSVDLGALLQDDPLTLEIRLAEILREARLGGELVYFYGHDLPQEMTGPMLLVIERMLGEEPLVFGCDRLPMWAADLTTGWPVVTIPLPDENTRFEMWKEAFAKDRNPPSEPALLQVARRYQLSGSQIRQAAVEARRLAALARRRRIELAELDRACRIHFAHQLSDLADLVPPTTFGIDDLVLERAEKEKFEEMMLYASERETIFSEWGFAEKFPYGRGLSMLFYGPPGTGKSMSSMIIAGALGIDLFRIDLSRILSRYVGETEKNLARIFDEAERGRVMLLFDEADSLFTKRTDVSTSVDRYANLEVAYLLQRMENFEGITVLTTNVEHMLDDAFKRRIRYRIYFPSPEAHLRIELWRRLLPDRAPRRPDIPFELLGEHFDLAGGYIKQAVLRSAVYARRDDQPISLSHLVEAALTECRELGMLISNRLPKPLQVALDAEKASIAAAKAEVTSAESAPVVEASQTA